MDKEIEAFLELKNLVERMNEEVSCVLVEGRKDKEALKKIGYKGRVVYVNKFREVEGKIVILTDFDEEGKEAARRIIKTVGEKNIDTFFRNKFRKILKSIGRNDIQAISNLCKKYEEFLHEQKI